MGIKSCYGPGAERVFTQGKLGGEQLTNVSISQDSAPMTTLKNLIGLGNVKQLVSELEAYINIKKHRENFNLKNEPLVLHMIFKGNPGTGKTTVARLLGQILLQLQVLPQGHLVEIERADLVGEYIGHTAQKTREQIKRAMGGILFVDEAYSLARGGEKDFGKEAVDTMVKAMEDHKDEFVLILAGYTAPMEEFLRLNPGLKSRFPIQLNFPDYTIKQLLEISQLMLAEREYKLTARATARLREILEQRFLYGTEDFSNARLVRNILELAIRRHALRLKYVTSPTKDQLQTLESCDILQSQATQAEGI